jgi:hypothetical protein
MQDLNNLVRAAIFCALAVGLGYSLVLVPNVELITVTVFLAGLTLGIGWGTVVGAVAMAIFSGLNPMGSGLSFPPLYLAQILAMAITGSVGGGLKPVFFRSSLSMIYLAGLALTGLILTLFYDGITLVSYPLTAGLGWNGVAASLIKGLGFTLLHEISNAFIFFVAVPRVTKYLA